MNPCMTGLIASIVLAWGLASSPARCAEAPQLVLKMNAGSQAGKLRDGTRLGRGTLTSHDVHSGFQIWSEQSDDGSVPAGYVLRGSQNTGNRLRVRLEPAAPLRATQTAEHPGIALNTGDERVTFDVLADGDQSVKADSYALEIKGALLLP